MPDSFEAFEGAVAATYKRLVEEGTIIPQPDVTPPTIPLDLEAAKKAGKVHRPKSNPALSAGSHKPHSSGFLLCTSGAVADCATSCAGVCPSGGLSVCRELQAQPTPV